MHLSRIASALKAIYSNPGRSFVVIFAVILALKTFVIPSQGEMPGADIDLQGIASPHVDPGPLIEPVE